MVNRILELTDSRGKGIKVFREIPRRYQALKTLTESVEQRPTVMFNTRERQLQCQLKVIWRNWLPMQEQTTFIKRMF